MPDCFISYANEDSKLAEAVKAVLEARGVSVFMASVSLKPGDEWGKEIKRSLLNSHCVIFLASRRACESPFVLQELGMALGASKKVIPVVWDIDPSELPGWIPHYQAIDVRGGTMSELTTRIDEVAKSIQIDKIGAIILMAIGAVGAFILLSPDKPS